MPLDIEIKSLEEILKNFYILSGFRIGIFDVDGKEVTAYPQNICSFCDKLRENKEANDLCLESDMNAFKYVSLSKDIHIYQCPFGLSEAVAPILEDKNVIGFIMIGQMIEDGIAAKNVVFSKCNHYFEDTNTMELLLNEVGCFHGERIIASTSLMNICASYFCLTKQIKLMRTLQSRKLKEYLILNFRNQITLGELCNIFKLSRTSIINLFKRELGTNLNNYLNGLRMEEAKRLLDETELQIKLISTMSGFVDQNYFSRIFKKRTGLTPTQYRMRKIT